MALVNPAHHPFILRRIERMMYDNALEEWAAMKGAKCPLPANVIHSLRDRECSEARKIRRQNMIEHGDVDPDYFNR